jgi:hypothetical protein
VNPDSAPTYREFRDLQQAVALLDGKVDSIDARLVELHSDVIWMRRTLLGAIATTLIGLVGMSIAAAAGAFG